jgi:hypothetical protein
MTFGQSWVWKIALEAVDIVPMNIANIISKFHVYKLFCTNTMAYQFEPINCVTKDQ